ncbi:hypothetical protein J132_03412 [Termitomyces sp. J132]|nr:hypothetical protein J132_03412 [Termitomyces sp. J132]
MASNFKPHIPLDSKLGAAFIGNLIAAVFYGITCVQTYMYSKKSDRDRTWFKGVIYFLWILDTLHLAMISHALYYYLISNFGNLVALVSPSWTNSLVRMLMLYTINTSKGDRICSITCFIAYAIWPDDFTFIGIYFSLSKLFLNSLLATLNSRHTLSEKIGGVKTFSGTSFTATESSNALGNKHQQVRRIWS